MTDCKKSQAVLIETLPACMKSYLSSHNTSKYIVHTTWSTYPALSRETNTRQFSGVGRTVKHQKSFDPRIAVRFTVLASPKKAECIYVSSTVRSPVDVR